MFHVPEEYRVTHSKNPMLNSTQKDGNNGTFAIKRQKKYVRRDKYGRAKNNVQSSELIFIQASDGMGWEHVSVSLPLSERTPSWEEMCYVKDLFWDVDDVVIQFHPSKKDYVNNHPRCLHLWRPTEHEVKTPPPGLVGIKGYELDESKMTLEKSRGK